ncbi:MAG: tetratricopeptide repeat protein [Bacteroidetes bacterium]|nr:tetratricopeptide repeat protein [Bacteroidota bacterium]
MKKLVLLLTFNIQFITSFAQQNTRDSLLAVLKTAKEDTNKVNILNSLSKQLWKTNDFEQAKKQAGSALTLAQKLNFKAGEANAYNNFGIISDYHGDYPEALKNYFASVKIYIETGNKKGIASSYNNIGIIYDYQGDYPNALKNYFASLTIKIEIGDKKGIANSYNNIGLIYANQGNYPEALKNYFASLKIKANINDKKGLAASYNNIGNIYIQQGNYPEALKNYFASLRLKQEAGDKKGIASSYNNIGNIYYKQGHYPEALKNYLISLNIDKEVGNKKGLANSYNNIAGVYSDQDKYPEALKNYFASLELKQEIGDKEGIASSFMNIGTTNISLQNFSVAKKYLETALDLSIEIGSKDDIKDSYYGLSTLDSAQGNWKDAYKHHKLFIIYRDSLDNEETKEKTIQASMSYEFEKKEALTKAEQDKKDALAATEMKKQQIIRYAVSGVLGLVILFTFFLYNRFRLIRKQKNIIELKEKETQLQKEVIEEKHKEITDSINYAERIQRSFLATSELLNKNLKDYFVFFKPKDVVSGDFYWAGELNNGNFAFSCADSTGHGVPGAIMSILNISSLEKSIEQENEPDKILNKTREIIIERLKKDGSPEGGKDGMDCSLMVINKDRTLLSFAAANNAIFIIRNNELIEYKPDKMPVGKHSKDLESFNLQTAVLQKGDIIYSLTDGFPDQFGGEKGKKYMIKNLKEFLLQIAPLSMQEQEQKLAGEFIAWKGGNEQVDDVCIIGVRI